MTAGDHTKQRTETTAYRQRDRVKNEKNLGIKGKKRNKEIQGKFSNLVQCLRIPRKSQDRNQNLRGHFAKDVI